MPEPKLTIGIPTFNRPERCQRAIQSALGQSLPVNVIVADDGSDDECERVCKEYEDHPHFKYIRSPATNIWDNWRYVAKSAIARGAEYFMWLQDDDLLAARTARRVVRAFDFYPGASVWCASLRMAYDNMLGFPQVGNWGPILPCDVLYGQPTMFSGKLLTPVAYFASWSMAPAKAFRVNGGFLDLLEAIPNGCDQFTERLDIATAGLYGEAIHDPASAGLWIIHERNASQLTKKEESDEQLAVAFGYLDTLMDKLPDWRSELFAWFGALGPQLNVIHDAWKTLKDHHHKSPYADQIFRILDDTCRSSGLALDEVAAHA